MPECKNCGEHVSQAYYRVFSVDGRLNACHSCMGHIVVDERMLIEGVDE